MRVTMESDGRHVKEVNPLGGYLDYVTTREDSNIREVNPIKSEQWLKAESQRRVFEIDGIDNEEWYTEALKKRLLKYDAIHEGELLPNGKIKLLS